MDDRNGNMLLSLHLGRDEATTVDDYRRLAGIAEKGKLDLLLLEDSRLEPFTLLGDLIAHTQYIGLGATVETSLGEPYAFARTLATLDHLSGGRIAWQAVIRHPRGNPVERAEAEDKLDRERHAEFIEVVGQLLDSWSVDALLIDKRSGRFLDADKVRFIDFAGQYFKVRGPLSVPRTPTGRPVYVAAADSVSGAERADIAVGRYLNANAFAGKRFGSELLSADHGSMRQFAERLAQIAVAEHKHGFVLKLKPEQWPLLEQFVQEGIPLLQERGWFRTEYEHTALRKRLTPASYPEASARGRERG